MPRLAPIARLLAILACALVSSCTYPATEVLVVVDTDIPVSQQLTLRITTRHGAVDFTSSTPPDRSFVVGPGDAGVGLPASFGIVPGDGQPEDGLVTLRVEAQSGAIALRRIVRFRFTPRQSRTQGVFLTLRCATPVSGCTHTSPCTQQDLCEERGEACGSDGNCVPVITMPMPTPDSGMTGMDASMDGRDATTDTRDATDIVPRDMGSGCGAGERACGGGCIPSGSCCVDSDCGGRVCSGGACVCPANTHDCFGNCIPDGACCTDSDCGGRACSGGACVCPANTHDCGGTCIADGSCCTDSECGANRVCTSGACRCSTSARMCGGTCIPNGTCCADTDCAAPMMCPSPGSTCACPSIARIPIYRFVNTTNNDHLFTTQSDEATGLPNWIAEGVRFYTYPEPCPAGTIRLMRFVNTSTNSHFYTSDPAEAASLPATILPEGAIGCVATSAVCGSTTLIRRLLCSGIHFYTTDRAEADAVCGSDEGSPGQVWLSM